MGLLFFSFFFSFPFHRNLEVEAVWFPCVWMIDTKPGVILIEDAQIPKGYHLSWWIERLTTTLPIPPKTWQPVGQVAVDFISTGISESGAETSAPPFRISLAWVVNVEEEEGEVWGARWTFGVDKKDVEAALRWVL